MKKLQLLICSILCFSIFCFNGCAWNKEKNNNQPISISDFKLNTIVQITIYDSADQTLLAECMSICDKYENIFSRTKEDSELYQLNHRDSLEQEPYICTPSAPLYELLSMGYDYYQMTDGQFNIAIAPITSLWNFNSDTPEIPDAAQIADKLSLCTWEGIQFHENGTISFHNNHASFDLGALAKGYVADKLKEYLVSQNVKSAIINLGGNVLCIGSKPDDTPFKIGIQKPFADRNETISVVDICDCSVVSSGIYERYFQENNVIYHHILDSSTGYPVQNDLTAVTIISETSVTGDFFSTACFLLGLEKGLDFASKYNIAAVFITKDYEVIYSPRYSELYI